jgi:restriction endonuclease Mrr
MVQAGRYADGNSVGSAAIRDFFGSLDRYKAAKGLFVTSATFSSSARQTAEQLSKRIVLKLCAEHIVHAGIRSFQRRDIHFQSL